MVILYHLLAFLALHLPRRKVNFLIRAFAVFRYWTSPVLKHRFRENLKLVLKANNQSLKNLEGLVKEGYLNFGRYLYEFFLIPSIDQDFARRNLEIVGRENLEEAFRKGKGVISLTAHLGNWELAGIFTALIGYPITAVALSHKSRALNRFFLRRRQVKGVKVVPLGTQTKRLITALRRNELVALLGDRAFGPPYLEIDFFGRPALLPAGPAQLAVKLGSPVVPGFLVREGEKYRLFFEPAIYPAAGENGEGAVRELAQKSVFYLEKYIKAYPSQWLVFDYIWKR